MAVATLAEAKAGQRADAARWADQRAELISLISEKQIQIDRLEIRNRQLHDQLPEAVVFAEHREEVAELRRDLKDVQNALHVVSVREREGEQKRDAECYRLRRQLCVERNRSIQDRIEEAREELARGWMWEVARFHDGCFPNSAPLRKSVRLDALVSQLLRDGFRR